MDQSRSWTSHNHGPVTVKGCYNHGPVTIMDQSQTRTSHNHGPVIVKDHSQSWTSHIQGPVTIMDQSQSWTSHSQGMLQSWTSHNHSFIQHNFIDRKRRLLHLHYQLLTLLHDNALYTFIHLLGEPTRAGFCF